MGWLIKCNNQECNRTSYAKNIDVLMRNHRDNNGWFKCDHCDSNGHIFKSFKLQEAGTTWEPYLRGAIELGVKGVAYQPFVFMVSYEPSGPAYDIWFSYYKDTRKDGGRLKMGYGPGGPPVLGNNQLIDLLSKLIDLGIIEKAQIIKQLGLLKK